MLKAKIIIILIAENTELRKYPQAEINKKKCVSHKRGSLEAELHHLTMLRAEILYK